MDTLQIDLSQLENIFSILMQHIREQNDSIELSRDYYWNIPANSMYDVYSKPTQLTIGQLSSDWSELQALATGKREPLAYDLVWLAAILRSIGETTMG